MFQTDLQGFINEVKKNKICQLMFLIFICIIIYVIVSKYMNNKNKNNFNDVRSNILFGGGYNSSSQEGNCKGDIPKMDEAIIRNMIDLPNRDPKLLTSSMVVPEITTSDEARRQTRMDVLNMFYNSFDDDLTSYNKRPRGLYLTP